MASPDPPTLLPTIRVVVLALAFWFGREVTILIVIVSQIGLARAVTLALIVTRVGFAPADRDTFGRHRGTFRVIGILVARHRGTFWMPFGQLLLHYFTCMQ